MPKYRKKPIVIEAMQYTVESCREIHRWMGIDHDSGVSCDVGILIPTLEGVMEARINDFIIRGVKGEFYPCKPDIFAATYDEVPMPTDPATVPPLTEQEIAQFRHEYRTTQTSFEAILNAVYALAASRVDTAEVERRAARKACNAMRDWFIGPHRWAAQTFSEHRDCYLAREYPAPAPRECVSVDEGRIWYDGSGNDGPWFAERDRKGEVTRHCDGTLVGVCAAADLIVPDHLVPKLLGLAAEVGQ